MLGVNFSFTGDRELNGVFVGLDNYVTLLGDERFQASATQRPRRAALRLPSRSSVAGILATFIFLSVPGHRFYRSVYFLPVVLSPVIIGAIFNIVLGANGPLNGIAESVGLPTRGLARQTFTALPSVLDRAHLGDLRHGDGDLPGRPLDARPAAARCARRSTARTCGSPIVHVIIPGLSQTIVFVFVTTTIGMLTGMFGLLYIDDAGGPGAASYLPEFLIWKLNGEARPALASAASVFLLVIVLVIGLIQIRVLRRATKEV